MSDYQLSIGAPKGDAGADIYADFVDLTVTRTASSMGSWSATLPARASFESSLLEKVWIYHEDEIVFRGELESFDADYESATTTVNGRGIFVEMDRQTTSVQYQNTTVYDALVDYWEQTDWDALVLPPNRDVRDELYNSDYDHAEMWSFDGARDGYVTQDNVHIDRNRFVTETSNFVVDESAHTDCTYSVYSSDQTDVFWALIETDTAVTQLDFGMHRQYEWSSEGIIEEVWDSETHDTPQHVHLFKLEFSEEWDRFRPKLEIYDESIEILRTEIFIPDESGYATIDDVEIEGTRFDILQELHDLGSYEFVIDDHETLDVRSFPTGTLRGEPDWRITSSNRSLDYTDYANSVTVQGRTQDDGSTNTATAQNQDEIDEMSQRGVGDDGVVENFEKTPDLQTQAEVDSRAERLLAESVTERDESGSIEIVPQAVAPGYTYNVSAWGDAFPYGSQIGSNSLYFDGDDVLDLRYDGGFGSSNGRHFTWEFLIHPEELSELGDNEYYTLLDWDAGASINIRIYGDGSIRWGENSAVSEFTRTDPHVVREDQTQRLSIQWGEDDIHRRRVYVDGQIVFDTVGAPASAEIENYWFYLGADRDGNHGFTGGIDDVRLWMDTSYKSQDWITEYAYRDLITTEENLTECPVYLRFDDHTDESAVVNDGASMNFYQDVGGLQYQEAFGQIEEVQYSLGSGDTLTLDFDISGRIDTELVSTQRSARTNRRSL